MKKTISISVYGDSPKYCVGAIKNAKIAHKLLPDWTCRFFINHTVPFMYIEQLTKLPNVEISHVGDDQAFGMFWRFYPMFETNNDVSISRDADSRISEREVKIINEWLESDKKFSIIRDNKYHYEWPILGGLWGIKGCLDKKLFARMIEYGKKHEYLSDQIFLMKEIWLVAQQDCIIHSFNEVEWMRETRDPIHFVGQGYDENDVPIYT